MDLASILARVLTGGADELSGDNLVRLVVDGIVAMRTRGRRGRGHVPAEVEVVVTVGRGSPGVVQSLVDDPGFDEEVRLRLQNRLVEVPVAAHPMRLYRVVDGERNGVEVHELEQPVALELRVQGGGRHGDVLRIGSAKRELRVGRGPQHGSEYEENDLIVTHDDAYVSRRAARIERLGRHVRVRALDQADALQVVRADGTRIRPHRTIEGWVSVRPGDRIELTDGADQAIALVLQEAIEE